ncbi:MAG TPA: hypothetical protein VN759_02790, partial [Pseudolysinimonas sp.]|nr:hypothetical protein [Pseudolysinimonas sp.]
PLPPGVSYVQVSSDGFEYNSSPPWPWHFHSVALRSDGAIASWGDNDSGQGDVPPPPAGHVWVEVEAGHHVTAALASDGSIVCAPVGGSLDNGVPPLPPGLRYVEVAVGALHAVARRSDGSVVAWGANFSGECNVPPLPPGQSYVEVAAGEGHSLARRSDGSVVAFGNNSKGQCDVPALPAGRAYVQISAALNQSAARIGPAAPAIAYCTSKPSSIPGCVSALAAPFAVASVSAGHGSFALAAAPTPGGGNPGIGIYTTQGPLGAPIQNAFGWLCIGSPVLRTQAVFADGTAGVCNGHYALDFGGFLATQVGNPALVAGATVDVQFWYRDPPNPGAANFSGAIHFLMCP